METLPSKRFAISLPSIADPEFARIQALLIDTVTYTAIRLRTKCAIENGVSFLDTVAYIVPDPDRPNVVTVTARPIAVRKL